MNSLRQLLPVVLLGTIASPLLLPNQPAQAAEWVKVTENAAKDSFFIDASTIKKTGNTVNYWEYREFIEPNNPFLENPLDKEKPVYGVVIRWTADCGAKTQRLRRVNAFSTNRELLQRFDYGDTGTLSQPRPGSSGYEVLETACNPKKLEATKPVTKSGDSKPTDGKPAETKPR
jgi:hypothetical protein